MKVRLENIVKKYGHTIAVDDFSAELKDGHLICLLGPSGCGKSTILNMLCGIADVTAGKIFFDDKDVTKLPPDQRSAAHFSASIHASPSPAAQSGPASVHSASLQVPVLNLPLRPSRSPHQAASAHLRADA